MKTLHLIIFILLANVATAQKKQTIFIHDFENKPNTNAWWKDNASVKFYFDENFQNQVDKSSKVCLHVRWDSVPDNRPWAWFTDLKADTFAVNGMEQKWKDFRENTWLSFWCKGGNGDTLMLHYLVLSNDHSSKWGATNMVPVVSDKWTFYKVKFNSLKYENWGKITAPFNLNSDVGRCFEVGLRLGSAYDKVMLRPGLTILNSQIMNLTNKKMMRKILISSILVFTSVLMMNAQVPTGYKGKPYKDKYYKRGAQTIPGRVELAYYDFGGEGIAYHDVTSENEGAKLNREVHDYGSHKRPGISDYIAFFRENEGVDISYTKDWADFNHPNKVDPAVNQLYIGWQSDGEWTNYTVDVKVPGRYKIITVYGYQDNKSSLWLNGEEAVKLVLPENTGNWHYWTQATVGEITFTKTGLQLLTLKYNAGANLAYFDFVLIEELKK